MFKTAQCENHKLLYIVNIFFSPFPQTHKSLELISFPILSPLRVNRLNENECFLFSFCPPIQKRVLYIAERWTTQWLEVTDVRSYGTTIIIADRSPAASSTSLERSFFLPYFIFLPWVVYIVYTRLYFSSSESSKS